MPWKQIDACVTCGEPKRQHNRKGQCRFEQAGWVPIADVQCLPPMREIVMGRRNKEVFPVRRIERYPLYKGDATWEWGIPKSEGGNGLVDGLTHIRPWRRGDPKIDDGSYLTRKH